MYRSYVKSLLITQYPGPGIQVMNIRIYIEVVSILFLPNKPYYIKNTISIAISAIIEHSSALRDVKTLLCK